MLNRLIAVTLMVGVGLSQAVADTVPVWERGGLKSPESTLFDAKRNLIFVSNVDGQPLDKDGRGSIALLSPEGKMLNAAWQSGLNAPKGWKSVV